jgi:ribosome recycling factor
MLGSVFVDYYGSATPLSHKLSVPDARTITFSHLKETCFMLSKKQSW